MFHPDSARQLSVQSTKVYKTCVTYTTAECTVNKLLMMDRGTLRNM